MTTYTNITSASLEPGKPLRSVDLLALRDNPVAITEGASGAPKIQNAAMDDDTVDDRLLTGTATNVGRDWVLARTALASVGAVGTYAFLRYTNSANEISVGQSIAGSFLEYAGVQLSNLTDDVEWSGTSTTEPAGTWRAMGYSGPKADHLSATMFLRIA